METLKENKKLRKRADRYYECSNYTEAIKLYKIASLNGDIKSIYKLGSYYEKINKPKLAIECYDLGAKHNDIRCILNLAIQYDITGDVDKANEYYKIATEIEDPYILYDIASDYHHNTSEYTKAKKIYKLAIKCRIPEAMHGLGYYYEIICKDMVNAIKYYKIGANNGDWCCMYNIGHYYMTISDDHDYGNHENYRKAIKFYKMALENGGQNDDDVIYNLTLCYSHLANFDEAMKYCKIGADMGIQTLVKKLIYYLVAIKKYTEALEYCISSINNYGPGNYDNEIENDNNILDYAEFDLLRKTRVSNVDTEEDENIYFGCYYEHVFASPEHIITIKKACETISIKKMLNYILIKIDDMELYKEYYNYLDKYNKNFYESYAHIYKRNIKSSRSRK